MGRAVANFVSKYPDLCHGCILLLLTAVIRPSMNYIIVLHHQAAYSTHPQFY